MTDTLNDIEPPYREGEGKAFERSDRTGKIRANILNISNKLLDAYQLMLEGKYAKARVIIYEIERFEINEIYNSIIELEFKEFKEGERENLEKEDET